MTNETRPDLVSGKPIPVDSGLAANPTVTELTTPPDAPERGKPARAARVTGGVKPLALTSRAKIGAARTALRGGKQIGAKATKKKAEAESTPVARGKGAQNGITADQTIKRLKTIKERCGDAKNAQPGTERYNTFKLYRDGMTVAEFVQKGGKVSHLKRDVRYKHIELRGK